MKSTEPKINVVIPMAGLGSRFSEKGYLEPKPLIKIFGEPMIKWVHRNIGLDANYIFIVQRQHDEQFNATSVIREFCPDAQFVFLDKVTDGAARSLLMAKELINNDTPLFIVNSDNMIEWNNIHTIQSLLDSGVDGGIITTYGEGPKWSYASLDADGFVTKTAEKIEISNNATTGHYYWAKGKFFVESAEKMIEKNIRYNNEFYIAPVYNECIEKGRKIVTCPCEKFWSVGTPEDLDNFIHNCDVSKVKNSIVT